MINAQTVKPTANILIVDDITANLVILTEIIKNAGYVARPVTSARQAMSAIEVHMPQLILLDVSMPEMDGFEFCEKLKKDINTREIPIIFISALDSVEDKIKGFKLGAVDFISKPFVMEEVTLRINNHLKIYKMQQELEVYNRRLHKMVNDQLRKISDERKNIIYALAKLSEARENEAEDHMHNIGHNCRVLAMGMQFSPIFEKQVSNSFVDIIELAAPLHDIGKISISDKILLKPTKLTKKEMKIIETHTEIGAKQLMEIYKLNENNDFIKMAIDIAYYHHERWDGQGYPKGLAGEDIPLPARIMAVADVYDSLVSERVYKNAYSQEESIELIKKESGKMFDPNIIEIFNKIKRQLKG